MKRPIDIEVDPDLQRPPVYVWYSHEPRAGGYTADADGSVNVDLDAAGNVIGIELTEADDHTIRLALQVAHAHKLSFPATVKELLCA